MGRAGETRVHEILKTLDPTLRKTRQMFDRLDFEGDSVRVEHKTRSNTYSAYPTTLMPCDKAIAGDKPLYFSFGFTDGVYIIQYTPEAFADIEVAPFCRKPRAGIVDRPKPYFHIPVSRLVKIA